VKRRELLALAFAVIMGLGVVQYGSYASAVGGSSPLSTPRGSQPTVSPLSTSTSSAQSSDTQSHILPTQNIGAQNQPAQQASITGHTGTKVFQKFAVGSGTYSSNRNYFIMDNGTFIRNPVTTVTLGGPLVGTSDSKGYQGNWSFQVNGYAPPMTHSATQGRPTSYMQWVVGCRVASQRTVLMYLYVQYNAQNDLVLANVASAGAFLKYGFFAKGTQLAISLNTNTTGYAVGVAAKLTLGNGSIRWSSSLDLQTGSPMSPYLAPLVGLEAQLIGDGGADTATFTKAAGTISYQAGSPIGWTGNPPSFYAWVSYKNIGTVEKSNIAYGIPQDILQTGCSGHRLARNIGSR
jgi:hypothetical protein